MNLSSSEDDALDHIQACGIFSTTSAKWEMSQEGSENRSGRLLKILRITWPVYGFDITPGKWGESRSCVRSSTARRLDPGQRRTGAELAGGDLHGNGARAEIPPSVNVPAERGPA
jgi:hypothetical protein